MHLHQTNSPTVYVYALVDQAGSRFRLGLTPHRRYGLSVLSAYCPSESFQIGFTTELATLAYGVLYEQFANKIVDQDGQGIWVSIECLQNVRNILACVPAREELISIVMVDPDMVTTLACEAMDEILGLKK